METIYTFSLFFFVAGIGSILLALWSRNPKHIGTAVGRLDSSKRVMVSMKHSRKKVPMTNFVYLYEVNGKTYRLKRDTRSSRKSLMPRVNIVYLKGFPRFGYLESYPHWLFTLLGVILILCGVMTLSELQ
jgi:hypothetical protein